ncbi:MAG: protein kinase [bacterium]|nr:protein kinase [bacterium]
MLSREESILADFLVARRLVSKETVDRCARERDREHPGQSLADVLIDSGDLEEAVGRDAEREAREVDRSLDVDLSPETTLGEFRLVREIGRGGMGVVYEAVQESLGRRVAVKVLPAGAALDERMALRFLRESRSVAQLRHPGIVPVHASGHSQGVLFFAMELIEGSSLQDRLQRGPLPPRAAARIVRDIARALQHAHDAGMIHRDVKPDNVLIDRDGRARITDFGLVHDVHSASITAAHHMVGTPSYLAPEQALGEEVDRRSDVYGLGAVLYAALCGSPPYGSGTAAVVLRRLAAEDPEPLARVARDIPRELVAICERAMARDRDRRYPSAAALAEDLDRLLGGRPLEADPGERVVPRWMLWGGVALSVAILAGALLLLASRSGAPPPTRGWSSGLIRGSYRTLSPAGGSKPQAVLTPDGGRVVYTAHRDGVGEMYLEDLESGHVRTLNPDPSVLGARYPGPRHGAMAFSPDAEHLSFGFAKRFAVARLDDLSIETFPLAVGQHSWSPDGRAIVYTETTDLRLAIGRPVRILDLDSGQTRLLTNMRAAFPAWSPGGRRIAVVSTHGGRTDIWTISIDGGERLPITQDDAEEWYPVWSPDGSRLYFGSDRGGHPDLWSITIDEATGAVAGEPRRLSRGLMAAPFHLSAARGGRLAWTYFVDSTAIFRLAVDRDGGRPAVPPTRVIDSIPHGARMIDVSPAGEDLVFTTNEESGGRLFLLTAGSPQPTLLLEAPDEIRDPRWSPGGARIAFEATRDGEHGLWVADRRGRNVVRLVEEARSPVWSPDGARIAYAVEGRGAYVIDLDPPHVPTRLPSLPGGGEFAPGAWSHDGKWIAGESNGIVVYSVENGNYRRFGEAGEQPRWLDDGRRLLVRGADGVRLLDTRSGRTRPLLSVQPNRLVSFAVSGDGREIFYSVLASDDPIWLVDLGADAIRASGTARP